MGAKLPITALYTQKLRRFCVTVFAKQKRVPVAACFCARPRSVRRHNEKAIFYTALDRLTYIYVCPLFSGVGHRREIEGIGLLVITGESKIPV
jgi:hypothetical protein